MLPFFAPSKLRPSYGSNADEFVVEVMLRQAKADVVAVAVAVVVALAARQNILEFNCTYLPSYLPACLADEAVFLFLPLALSRNWEILQPISVIFTLG